MGTQAFRGDPRARTSDRHRFAHDTQDGSKLQVQKRKDRMAGVKLKSHPQGSVIMLAACLIAAFGFWYWALNILAPANTVVVIAAKRPVGNNSDLYPRWLGARELLLRGRDPYSSEVTRDIQTGFYGRALDARNPADPVAQESFVYPLYVVFLMAPTVTLPFPVVMVIFRWLLLFASAFSVPLWMYALGFRPRRLLLISSMLLAVSSFPAVEEYFQQNLSGLALLFLAAATAAAVRKWLTLSGFLLALATIKPDTTGLVVLWFLFWGIANWKERRRLLLSFGVSMTVLIVAGDLISPHWIGRFLAEVRRYPTYGTDPSILESLLPRRLAMLVTVALLSGFLALCWRWRRCAAGSENFGWTLAWGATITLTVIPKLAAYNQLLLIPVFVMLVRRRRVFAFWPRTFSLAMFACQAWQWLTAVALSVASYWMTADRLRTAALVPLYTFLAVPPLALMAVVVGTLSAETLLNRQIRVGE